MCKRLISIFLLLIIPFNLNASGDVSLSETIIEEEFDDDELLIVLVAGVIIVTGAIVLGPSILEDGGLLGPPKYWEAKIGLLFGINL